MAIQFRGLQTLVMAALAIWAFGDASSAASGPLSATQPPASVSLGLNELAGQVSASGAFSYSVPIRIPPGRGGATPELSLAYSSQSSNGLAGVGWSLVGLPVIQRVATGQGVQYAGADSFALNLAGWGVEPSPRGRMVPVLPGQFHTTFESWHDIRPVGSCGDGPCSWVARDGRGNTLYFGARPGDSPSGALWERPSPAGGPSRGIAAWGLVRLVDAEGNAYEVGYPAAAGATLFDRALPFAGTAAALAVLLAGGALLWVRDRRRMGIAGAMVATAALMACDGGLGRSQAALGGPGGECAVSPLRPEKITYSSHVTQIAPVRTIDFIYECRPDPTPGPAFFEERLLRIAVRDGARTLAKYDLNYRQSAASTRRSLLAELSYEGDGAPSAAAAPPLAFSYGQESTARSRAFQVTPGPHPLSGWRSGGEFLVGDVNGDGRDDLVSAYHELDGREIRYALGSPTGLGPVVLHTDTVQHNGELNLTGPWRSALADINGDGRDDLVLVRFGPKVITTAYALGQASGLGPIVATNDAYSVDYSNDDGTPFACEGMIGAVMAWCGWRVSTMDINNDGRMDLVVTRNTGPAAAYAFGSDIGLGPLLPLSNERNFAAASRSRPADLNGDGYADLIVVDLVNRPLTFSLGSAGGLGPLSTNSYVLKGANTYWGYESALPVATDLDGDRRSDIVFGWSSTQIGVAYGGAPAQAISKGFKDFGLLWVGDKPKSRLADVATADFDGDGIGDILLSAENPANLDTSLQTVFQGRAGQTPRIREAPAATPYFHTVGDFTGDGGADIIYFETLNGLAVTTRSSFGPGGLTPAAPYAKPTLIRYEPNEQFHGSRLPWAQPLSADLNGDRIRDLILVPPQFDKDDALRILLSRPGLADRLIQVSNGLGGTVRVQYATSTDMPGAINKGATRCGGVAATEASVATCGIPASPPRELVRRVERSFGSAPIRSTRYEYSNGRFRHTEPFGLADLGFESINAIDEQTGQETRTRYRQDFPFVGLVASGEVVARDGTLISQKVLRYAEVHPYAAVRLVQLASSLVQNFEQGQWVRDDEKVMLGYDAYGNVARRTVCRMTICTKTLASFQNDLATWRLGRPRETRLIAGDGSGGGAELRLDQWKYAYAAGHDGPTTITRLLCDDAEQCLCPPGQDCTKPASPVRWVNIESDRRYDAYGNLTRSTDALGRTVEWDHEQLGGQIIRERRTVRQGGALKVFEAEQTYDPSGRLRTQTYPGEPQLSYTYDSQDRMIRIDNTAGPVTRLELLDLEKPAKQRLRLSLAGPGGADLIWSELYFDGSGEVWRVRRAGEGGRAIDVDYANRFLPDGRRLYAATKPNYVGDPAASILQAVSDARGRLVSQSLRDGPAVTFLSQTNYLPGSIHTIQPSGMWELSRTDPRGLTVQRETPAGEAIATYDIAGRISAQRLARGALFISYGYDSWGRLKSYRHWPNAVRTYSYDDLGHTTSQVDGLGRRTDLVYDELGRLISRSDAEGITTYAYEAGAPKRLSRIAEPSGALRLWRDKAGNIRQSRREISGAPQALTNRYWHDVQGRVRAREYPDGRRVEYTYGSGRGLIAVHDAQGKPLARFGAYTATGKVGVQDVGSTRQMNTYRRDNDLLQETQTRRGTLVLEHLRFKYDSAGLLIEAADLRPGQVVAGVNTSDAHRYGYDAAWRLTSAQNAAGVESLAYDEGGNLSAKGDVAYKHAGDHISTTAGLGSSAALLGYDAAGNIATQSSGGSDLAYTYDTRNRLRSVRRNGVLAADYLYDDAGQRIAKRVYLPQGGVQTSFTADSFWLQTAAGGPGPPARSAVIEGPGIGPLMTWTEDSSSPQPPSLATPPLVAAQGLAPPKGKFTLHRNAAGDIEWVSNAAGQTVTRQLRRPYGEVIAGQSLGQAILPLGWRSAWGDEETGLVLSGARYFAPMLGRFYTPDPEVALTPLDPIALNRYAFGRDNPVRYGDPTGWQPRANQRSWTGRAWERVGDAVYDATTWVGHTWVGETFSADYVTLEIGYGSGSGVVAFDTSGAFYLGGSFAPINIGPKPAPGASKWSLSLLASKVKKVGSGRVAPTEVPGFVEGGGWQVTGCITVCAAVSGNIPNNQYYSTDVGIMLGPPTISFEVDSMWQVARPWGDLNHVLTEPEVAPGAAPAPPSAAAPPPPASMDFEPVEISFVDGACCFIYDPNEARYPPAP